MADIKIGYTYRYSLHGVSEPVKIYVVKQKDGLCQGSVLYFAKSGTWATLGEKVVDLDVKNHFENGTDFNDVRDACLAWCRAKYGEKVVLGEPDECAPS